MAIELKDVVSGLTADAAPDTAADYAMILQGGVLKKVLLQNLNLTASAVGLAAANAYCVAAGVDGDTDEVAAARQLAADVDPIWDKIIALYLFRGATVADKVFNFVDPVDADSAYRLTPTNCTADANGIILADETDILDTHIIPDSRLAFAPFMGMGWYSQGADYQFFGTGLDTNVGRVTIEYEQLAGQAFLYFWGANGNMSTDGAAAGFHHGQRENKATDTISLYKADGTLADTQDVIDPEVSQVADDPILIGGNATNSTTLSAFWITKELTVDEVQGFRDAIQTYMTAIGADV